MGDRKCLKAVSIVPTELDFATVFPAENDAFLINNDEAAWNEAGMIKSTPQKIISQGTDWRFLKELKKELKT